MKRTMKSILVLMVILTTIYIGAAAFAYARVNDYNEVVLSAEELTTQPSSWKTPEELGIIDVTLQTEWAQVLVPKENAYQLQKNEPTFKYGQKFYKILGVWTTPGLPESVLQQQYLVGRATGAFGILIVGGWIGSLWWFHREKKNMMKKTAAILACLLMVLTCVSIPTYPVRASEEDVCVTPGLPEEVYNSQITNGTETLSNVTDTTNPYRNSYSDEELMGEVSEEEGNMPLYVLVFCDEEEKDIIRQLHLTGPIYISFNWTNWARLQLERSDEALVSNFGIDLRILGFLERESDDSIDRMYYLWTELVADTMGYIGQWYDGEHWDGYVDAIIGITAQSTIDNRVGIAPAPVSIEEGKICILLKWQVYWVDDNLAQHEISHLFYADDHYDPCCAMSNTKHWQYYIYEDGFFFLVFNDIPCGFTSYHWCTTCTATINSHIYWYHPSSPVGGAEIPINRLQLITPYVLCIAAAISITALVLIKRSKKASRRNGE